MTDKEILIIGAGPVGLTAALAVRSLGRPATVIETGDADRIRPGSRAIFIHKASLQILEKILPGLGYRLNEHGLPWLTKRTFYRGREIFARTYPAPPKDKLPAATSLPQVVTEQVLYKACLEAGVEFIWNSPVVSAVADPERVQVETQNGTKLIARYVIGADGSRSAVRESAGLRLEGPRTTNAYVIVDTAEDPKNPSPPERIFHYEHPAVDGRNVLFVPFAGHWRVDLQCHATDDPEKFSEKEGARAWLPKVMRADYADRITWVSTYIFRQAISNRFVDQHKRILLAGEAAHIFAPFGARGLNSGMADAFVAANAIDQALRADSTNEIDQAIEHFAQARRDAAERNRAASNTALRHLTTPTLYTKTVRRIAGALASHSEGVAKWMDKSPYGPVLGPPDSDGMQY